MKTKICGRCHQEKSINEFYKSTQRHKYGVHSNCKKCVIQYQKMYRKNNPIKSWCSRTVRDHRRSGYKVLFKAKDLLPLAKQTRNCPICNIKLGWKFGKGKAKNNSPTLDRIDNEKILTLSNVQIICRRCNTTKQDRTLLEFYDYCKNFVKLMEEKWEKKSS